MNQKAKPIIYTVGVYNSTEDEFFGKLLGNEIDLFCDIRQRRGVRGSKYAFVNSKRLQNKLGEIEIEYMHEIGLAPTPEVRNVQKRVDKENKLLKSEREGLSPEFIAAYRSDILAPFDLNSFMEQVGHRGVKKIAFFCVEEEACSCHRSILAGELAERGYTIKNI